MPAPYNIFLAEDNPGDVALFKLALRENAIECTLAVHRDGASALSGIIGAETAAEKDRPGLFVLDLNLGKVDGIVLLKRLRESPVFRDTPVVIWTTSDSQFDRKESAQNGANRHICKPTHLEEFMKLGAVIGELLESSRPADLTVSPK